MRSKASPSLSPSEETGDDRSSPGVVARRSLLRWLPSVDSLFGLVVAVEICRARAALAARCRIARRPMVAASCSAHLSCQCCRRTVAAGLLLGASPL